MMGRNASVCCWFRWTTVLGIDRVWNGIIASNRGELEERGLCTCVSWNPEWISTHTHKHKHSPAQICMHTHEHHGHAHIMTSSSLGRCTHASQRGGNITFLFLWELGNKNIVYVYAGIPFQPEDLTTPFITYQRWDYNIYLALKYILTSHPHLNVTRFLNAWRAQSLPVHFHLFVYRLDTMPTSVQHELCPKHTLRALSDWQTEPSTIFKSLFFVFF